SCARNDSCDCHLSGCRLISFQLCPRALTDCPTQAAAGIGYSTIALHHHAASSLRHKQSKCAYPGTGAAQVTRIMQQMRSGPIQLRALAEELDARQEAKCQEREIDLVHDPSAQPDER